MMPTVARPLEYAYGTEPWISTPGAFVITGWLAGHRLNVSFPRRMPGSSELLYTLGVSRNLLDWDQLQASLVQTLPLSDRPGLELVTYQTDATLAQETAQFVRLRVTLP